MFGSSGPNSCAKSTCCSGVNCCAGKISTPYFQKAALIASRSAGDSGCVRSTSPTSAAKSGVNGKSLMATACSLDSLCRDADFLDHARPSRQILLDVGGELLGATGDGFGPVRLHPCLHVRILHDREPLPVQPCNDRRGRS